MSWQEQCIQRLLAASHADGGWSYQPAGKPCAEPTALACLALAERNTNHPSLEGGLRRLATLQQPDGGVAVNANVLQPCWATALACLAWNQTRAPRGADYSSNQKAAVECLLRSEGKPFKSNPAIYGHNTQLKGWSWVDGTHSWIEPTAYSILALRSAELAKHARTREGVSLLWDRAMPHGGWNYGNSMMFGSELRPFPAQTGMALAALAGEPRRDCIDKAIEFLHEELPRIRTPLSLGWGLIGATAWRSRPEAADDWLSECADRVSRRSAAPVCDAMLLLADSTSCPLVAAQKELALGI